MKQKRNRHFMEPKIRGRKNKQRVMVKVSDVTADGFVLRTCNREYYIRREEYPWFKDAAQRELQNMSIAICQFDDPTEDPEEGDHIFWDYLDVILGKNTFEYPGRYPIRSPSVRGVLRLDLFDKEREEREAWEKEQKSKAEQ